MQTQSAGHQSMSGASHTLSQACCEVIVDQLVCHQKDGQTTSLRLFTSVRFSVKFVCNVQCGFSCHVRNFKKAAGCALQAVV